MACTGVLIAMAMKAWVSMDLSLSGGSELVNQKSAPFQAAVAANERSAASCRRVELTGELSSFVV